LPSIERCGGGAFNELKKQKENGDKCVHTLEKLRMHFKHEFLKLYIKLYLYFNSKYIYKPVDKLPILKIIGYRMF